MKIGIIFSAVLVFSLYAGNAFSADVVSKDTVKLDTAKTPEKIVVAYRIGIFGDSLGDGAWSGLYNTMKQHPKDKLFRHSKVGSGLTRSSFTKEMGEFTSQLDTDKIDVAVVMYGANDQQGIRDENHKGYSFKTDGWKNAYEARIEAMYTEFEKRKITVIWLGLPVMRSKDMNEGAVFLDSIFAEKAKAHNAIFVPFADDFKGPNHEFSMRYTDPKGKIHLLRADDGVHFTPYGYEMIANKVYKALLDSKVAAPVTVPVNAPAPAQITAPAVATTPISVTVPPLSTSAAPVIPVTAPVLPVDAKH